MSGLSVGVRASKSGRLTFLCIHPRVDILLNLVLFVLIWIIALRYYSNLPANWGASTRPRDPDTEPVPFGNPANFTADLVGDETWDNYIASHTSTSNPFYTSAPVLTVADTVLEDAATEDVAVEDPKLRFHPIDEAEAATEPPESHTQFNDAATATRHKVLYDGPPIRSKTHQRYLTLATMFKNQRRWLREWLEFNLMVGVEHFIIYDNNSTDLPLEILQPYIDQGYVTYVPWPPQELPLPINPDSYLEYDQDEWFRDCLATCLYNKFTVHRQGPCQMAAFIDAIRRTKGGVSRWLAIWDIDEYIFPRQRSVYQTLPDILRGEYSDASVVRLWGSVFGTSGHVEHAAQRKEGDQLQALMTENYIYRANLDRTNLPIEPLPNFADENVDPFAKLGDEEVQVHGLGRLESVTFGGGDAYGRKAIADPEMVLTSWVHWFEPHWSMV